MNEQISLLFRELADLPPEERETILAARQVSPALRAEVESLLAWDSSGRLSLTECIGQAAAAVGQPSSVPIGGFCGPYRLVALLGSGGMGAVYLAERDDGEIQQRVAIKLLRADSDRPAWQERFLRERQFLAGLNHPSIARLLDASRTDQGQPYLIMEYVDGVPIDKSAEGRNLREQLSLFLKVCEGVAHAHQRLIIHRDLKPLNILVDRSGQPKLLDFGIAKLLDQTSAETQRADRLLTPGFASPEQIRGSLQTTATDIYSLGAVLYKMLTGRSPHESENGELQEIDIVAGTREIPAPRLLNPALPRDIESVLQKALRREPEQRYASVEAFSDDIRAFLESRPVQARSADGWYRTRKFLRRYWLPVAAAAAVVASLSAGVYLEKRGRMLAEGRFQQLRQLSNKMFDLDRRIRYLPGSTQARHDLVSASLEYLRGLKFDPAKDLDLAQEVADGYVRIGRIQGVPTELNLGEAAQAEESLKEAANLTERVLAAHPGDRAARFRSGDIANDRMILAQEAHRRADAIGFAHKSGEEFALFLLRRDATPAEIARIARGYANMAIAEVNMGLYPEAIQSAQRASELARAAPSAEPLATMGLSVLANALRLQDDLDAALRAIREARSFEEKAVYPNPTTRNLDRYGLLLREGLILGEDGGVSLDRPADAIVPLREALDLMEGMARRDSNDYTSRSRLGTAARELANILRHRDPGQSLEVYDLGIQRLGEIRNNLKANRDRAVLLAASSYPLRQLNRRAEARRRIDEAIATLRNTKDYPAESVSLDGELFVVLRAQADDEAALGNREQAAALYEELLGKVRASRQGAQADLKDAVHLAQFYEGLTSFYRQSGVPEKGDAIEQQRLELWRGWDRKLPNNAFVLRQKVPR